MAESVGFTAGWLRIAITEPYFYDGEADAITKALTGRGFTYVHLRKPDATDAEMLALIAAIPAELRERLTLHSHCHLAAEAGVGGVHLNDKRQAPEGWRGRVSRSCHTLEECRRFSELDYVTLSPIYPSISKPGYRSDLPLIDAPSQCDARIVALGGVTREREAELREAGFIGAAMLATAWRTPIAPDIFALQFITNPDSVASAVDQTAAALQGGCRWVQLRWKDASEEQLLDAARQMAKLCHQKGALLIIDDHVSLVRPSGADGVHLGQNDMPVEQARSILGPAAIIGATANTYEHYVTAVKAGADYVGYGPLRFTTTKRNLSPVLGYEGYDALMEKRRADHLDIPVTAIGGITPDDIAPLRRLGVESIAVSGVILTAPDPADMTDRLLKLIAEN